MNIFEAFNYQFFIFAFIAVTLLSPILPVIGIRLANRGLSMIADTLAHTSLTGIAIGLVAGAMPIWISIVFSVCCSLLIELVKRKFPKYSEISLAIILSFSLGLVGILSKYAPANRFESYLFGSLYNISLTEIIILASIVGVAIVYEIGFYRVKLSLSYSEEEAKAKGVPVILYSVIDTIVISIVIALASNIVGSLLVTSFISIPVLTSLKVARSNKRANFLAIIFSLLGGMIGLFVSFGLSLHVGGTIVMAGLAILLIVFILSSILKPKRDGICR